MGTLKNSKRNDNAPAGFGEVLLIARQNVTASPTASVTTDDSAMILDTAPTLVGTNGFVRLGVYAEYAELKHDIKGEAGAKSTEVKPMFFISGNKSRQLWLRDQLCKGEYHMILQPPPMDSSAPSIYLGDDQRGVDLVAASDSSNLKSAGKNGTTFTGNYFGKPMVAQFTVVLDPSSAA